MKKLTELLDLRSDSLPRMPFPLALVCILLSCMFSAAAAKLASPAEDVLSPDGILCLVLSPVFLPASVCTSGLTILLHRRYTGIVSAALSFAVMLICKADITVSVSYSLTVLFVSYVFAVTLISRETHFRKTMSLTLAYAFSVALALFAKMSADFGSFGAFADAWISSLSSVLKGTASVSPQNAARELLVMSPSYIGIAATVLSWLTEKLRDASFRVLSCENLYEKEDDITMPPRFALIFVISFLLMIFTSAEYNPLIHSLLKAVTYVTILPCASAGIRSLEMFMAERMAFGVREKIVGAISLLTLICIFGTVPSLIFLAVIGAVEVFKANSRKTTDDNSSS